MNKLLEKDNAELQQKLSDYIIKNSELLDAEKRNANLEKASKD